MVALVDYTVDEALRRGAPLAAIEQMLPFLERYDIETFDVSIKSVYGHRNSLHKPELKSRLRCRIRPSAAELALARGMGVAKAAVVWSNRRNPLPLSVLEAALEEVGDFADEVYLTIEDAGGSYYTEFRAYWPLVERYGVKRIIYCDNKSALDPFLARRSLLELTGAATCPVEFCGANAFGLATANSLAALRAGVEHVGTSVNGVGLRGRAAMEEVLMAVRHLWKQSQVPSGHTLADDCANILSLMNIQVPVYKAVIGRNVFAHESGIHVDGISKNSELYEVIRPEEVGLSRRLVIGKHSGTASLKHKFREWNMELEQGEAVSMLEQVRELAERQKGSLSDHQLIELYKRRDDSPRRQIP